MDSLSESFHRIKLPIYYTSRTGFRVLIYVLKWTLYSSLCNPVVPVSTRTERILTKEFIPWINPVVM